MLIGVVNMTRPPTIYSDARGQDPTRVSAVGSRESLQSPTGTLAITTHALA